MPETPSYLKDYPFHTEMNVYGEDIGYCMCQDKIKRKLSDSRVLRELGQTLVRCQKKVTSEWNRLSSIKNPPNPLGHPQRRALDFQDIVYVSPDLVGRSLAQVTFELGITTGFCGCNRRDQFEIRVIKRKLTVREWSKQSISFFDGCRAEIATDWISSAVQGEGVPRGLPTPSRIIRPEPGFDLDLNWIPHPHGLGRLNFKGLAAAASKVRQKVWDFGKEEGLLLRGLER
ncbi:MAG: hypothetical protein M1826_001807 [Phylliscum demangeonii]|nr:MAG: hypothetical protein M1826_001807 [Phylliscum demangeonii]